MRVCTTFSGYDSQCMALDRIGIPYELVAWSEIDKYAIAAHNAVYPQWADRNLGDITKVDWDNVPDFDLFTYSSPCQDFSTAGLQKGGKKVPEQEVPCFGNARRQSSPSDQNIFCRRMSRDLYRRSLSTTSAGGSNGSPVSVTRTSVRCSTRQTSTCRNIGRGFSW